MNYQFQNPIMNGADPFVLAYGGKYYMYCTRSDASSDNFFLTGGDKDGFCVYESSDLQTWECKGYCLISDDVMGEKWFWAPEVIHYRGKFYMVYTSEEHGAVAVSDSPLGPFIQAEKKWLSEDKMIDGHFFLDDDGQMYLYYVRLIKGNRIYVAKMSEDLSLIDEANERLLIKAEEPWETKDCLVTEGPFVLKHNGLYYLSYSANHTRCPDYAVGYAVSENPMGPFKKYVGNPILHRNEKVVGVGHHSFAPLPEGKFLCAYHCHASMEQFQPRKFCLDLAEFVPAPDGGVDILTIHGPTKV